MKSKESGNTSLTATEFENRFAGGHSTNQALACYHSLGYLDDYVSVCYSLSSSTLLSVKTN